MSDDFGTVNVKRGDRAREIEVLRQHYRTHRDALVRMVPDAPTEQLASEYQRLIASIDGSLRKLDELEGKGTASGTVAVPTPAFAETQRMGTAPGNRPLVSSAVSPAPGADTRKRSVAGAAGPPAGDSPPGPPIFLHPIPALRALGRPFWAARPATQ